MSDLITVERLENELVRLCGLLEDATNDLKDFAIAEAEAENEYRRVKAISYLDVSEGTVNEKNARVDKMCGQERHTSYLAKAKKEAQMELLRSLRAQLDAWRTIAASHRAEVDLAGRSVQRPNRVQQ